MKFNIYVKRKAAWKVWPYSEGHRVVLNKNGCSNGCLMRITPYSEPCLNELSESLFTFSEAKGVMHPGGLNTYAVGVVRLKLSDLRIVPRPDLEEE